MSRSAPVVSPPFAPRPCACFAGRAGHDLAGRAVVGRFGRQTAGAVPLAQAIAQQDLPQAEQSHREFCDLQNAITRFSATQGPALAQRLADPTFASRFQKVMIDIADAEDV